MKPLNVDIKLRVEQYIELRDEISRLDDEHKEKMKPFRDLLEKLNGALLDHLNNINSESVRTDAGTVYKTEKTSATIADGDAFMGYVIENRDWDLLDRRANKTAVAAYIQEHGALPPGINFSTTYLVGVRRK